MGFLKWVEVGGGESSTYILQDYASEKLGYSVKCANIVD